MKKIKLLTILLFVGLICFGQIENSENKITNKDVLTQLKSDIEKKIPELKKQLLIEGQNSELIEFTLDTFRINQLALKRMEIGYTKKDIITALESQAASYDILMKKYYNKLLKKLNSEHRKILIQGQKVWAIYKDAESKLIWTMKENYSGGGTNQSLNARESLTNLIKLRTFELSEYYLTIVEVSLR